MILSWLFSPTARHANTMRKHVYHLLCAQRDLLAPEALDGLSASLDEMSASLRSGAKADALKGQMEKLEKAANKWLKPYPHAAWRENIEVFLVTIAVAMALRTFFLQPFKIPTGSMQPTLFGVTSTNLINQPDVKFPTGFDRFIQWTYGNSYLHVVAQNSGPIQAIQEPAKLLIFSLWQKIQIGNQWQTILFPPDYGSPPQGSLQVRAGLMDEHLQSRNDLYFQKGDDVVRLKVMAGDYLFVDRVTFNFRKPRRGEIIVFETGGIDELSRQTYGIPGDQFYIKRLVGLERENLALSPDHRLIINGKRLEATAPGFEKVYTYDPAKGDDNLYFGHEPNLRNSSYFTGGTDYTIRTNHFMVMGDNTRSSLDSRFFGDVNANYIVGKSWFVYWPLTSRFGFGYQ